MKHPLQLELVRTVMTTSSDEVFYKLLWDYVLLWEVSNGTENTLFTSCTVNPSGFYMFFPSKTKVCWISCSIRFARFARFGAWILQSKELSRKLFSFPLFPLPHSRGQLLTLCCLCILLGHFYKLDQWLMLRVTIQKDRLKYWKSLHEIK